MSTPEASGAAEATGAPETSTPAARVAADVLKRGVARFRGFLGKDGADESGLASVSELCFINSAADSLVAVALAGTVFFNVGADQARSRVALYLLTTMAPFALLAPVIGPLLDRFHGRRIALGATMIARAGVCWALAGHTKGIEIFPLALASLIISRGFGISRAAVTPRVLPPGLTLVKANARVTFVGVIGSAIVAPLGLGLQVITNVDWVLRVGTVLFVVGAVICFKLPPHVDSNAGERPASGVTRATLTFTAASLRPNLGGLPIALRALMPMRGLVGFLTLFLAFQLRSGHNGKAALAGLGAAAVLGQATGLFIGNRLGRRRPELLITAALVVATVACIAGSVFYTRDVSLVVAGVAVLCASLGKLNLDAVLQRDVAEEVRTSAFARSETALQLSWVVGGAFGLIPHLDGTVALAVAAAAMVVAVGMEVGGLQIVKRARPEVIGGSVPQPTAVMPTAVQPRPTIPLTKEPPVQEALDFPGGG